MKNKCLSLTAILSVLLLLSSTALKAQTTSSDSKWRLGIGAEAMLPTGNLNITNSVGFGISPKLQYSLSDKLALTLATGYYNFFGKTYTGTILTPTSITTGEVKGENWGLIPVKAGIKAFVAPRFYLSGEAGIAFETSKYGQNRIDLAPSVGYTFGNWDVSGKYEHLIRSGRDSYGFAGLRVAYSFGL